MYISVVTLYVANADRAIDFYTKKLGWQKTMDAPMGEDRWVTVAPSGTATAFSLFADQAKAGGNSGVIMEVADVYQTCQELTDAGVEITEPPRSEPWGGWAMFQDSEGNIHGLHSSVMVRT